MSRRRYSRTEKADMVAEVERTSLTQTAESSGIPITTLKYWYDHPDFADIRTKTRDQLAEGSIAMAVIAQGELIRRIRSGSISDQALVAAFGVGIDKAQLLSGAATARTESRDITGTISDAELSAAIREAHRLTSPDGAPAPAEGAPEG
jgi:transposase-like protein